MCLLYIGAKYSHRVSRVYVMISIYHVPTPTAFSVSRNNALQFWFCVLVTQIVFDLEKNMAQHSKSRGLFCTNSEQENKYIT